MRHRSGVVAPIAVGIVLALGALPAVASAETPDEAGLVTRSIASGGVWYQDPLDGLVLMTGGAAAEACAGTATGDPLSEQFVVLPTGAISLLVDGVDARAWLYAAATVDEVCDTVASGGSPELLAQGTVRIRITDNDLLASQTRTNSFGDRASGPLTALDGSIWHVTGEFRAVVLPSDDGTCHCVMIRSDIRVASAS